MVTDFHWLTRKIKNVSYLIISSEYQHILILVTAWRGVRVSDIEKEKEAEVDEVLDNRLTIAKVNKHMNSFTSTEFSISQKSK